MFKWLFRILDQEVRSEDWLKALPPQDQRNVRIVGKWFQDVSGEGSGVFAVGGTVRAVRKGPKKHRARRVSGRKDIDLAIYTNWSHRRVRMGIDAEVRQNPPPGFQVEIIRKEDTDTGIPYFNLIVWPESGKPIHVLPPKPGNCSLDREIKDRKLGLGRGPFCRLRF